MMNRLPATTSVTERAYAKLNLTLDVLGLLPGGYHEISSVMQSVSLCDDVTVSLAPREGENRVIVTVSGAGFERSVPRDMRNTAAKVAAAFAKAAGISGCRTHISIAKRIPVGAGLGGGSADAAAVLRALNALFDNPFDAEALREIGGLVGADVPFCVEGKTRLAGGRGELLSTLPPLPDCAIVIVKPGFSVSTAELFRKIDSVKLAARPDTEGMQKALEQGDLQGVSHRVFNVFEQALTQPRRGEIENIKSRLLDSGALCAAMTGTGSAVFGIFEDAAAAGCACDSLGTQYGCFLCNPV